MKNKWSCSSWTSNECGFDPFWTMMERKCEICGFTEVVRYTTLFPWEKEVCVRNNKKTFNK